MTSVGSTDDQRAAEEGMTTGPMPGSLLPCGCHIRRPDYVAALCAEHEAEAASPLPEGRADGREAEAALRELVRLKDLKDRSDAAKGVWSAELSALRADYRHNKPKAWAAARAALAASVGAQPAAEERECSWPDCGPECGDGPRCAPAVPAVQPDDLAEAKSPGDRPMIDTDPYSIACPVCAVEPYQACQYQPHGGWRDDPHGERFAAAAVAAVRADLADRVQELQPSRDHDAHLWGWQSALAAAADLILGSS